MNMVVQTDIINSEDLVEEIVGEIQDEHDEEENEQIQKLMENKFIVNANIMLNDFHKDTNIRICDQNKENIDTVGGFVFSLINQYF